VLTAGEPGREPHADLVVRGRVFSGEPDAALAEAVAVRGATIAALGTRAESERWIGPETRVIDVGEGSVLAGFNDAHCHFTVGFGLVSDVDLLTAHGIEEILARVAAYARAHPEDEVIDGMGWDLADMPGDFYPTAADLDALVEDRAVLLWSEGPHAVWANSHALERAKLDGAPPLPPGVVALRDAQGEPTGVFLGRGLFGLFPFVPFPDLEGMKASIRRGLGEAARLGVTSVQDPVSPFLLPFLAELHDAGQLTLRFHVWGGLTRSPFGGGVEETLALRKEHGRADWITFGTLKGGVDGMPSLRTAAMLEPYADDPGTRGLTTTDPARLAAAVRAATTPACAWRCTPRVTAACARPSMPSLPISARRCATASSTLSWSIQRTSRASRGPARSSRCSRASWRAISPRATCTSAASASSAAPTSCPCARSRTVA